MSITDKFAFAPQAPRLLERLPRPLLSFACQGLISGISFIASFLLLHYADRADYTTFVLFINGYALLASLQNALWLQPLVTLSGRMGSIALSAAIRYGVLVSAVIAVTGGLLFVLYQYVSLGRSMWSWFSLLFLCSFVLLLVRDANRSAWLMLGKLPGLFLHDLAYLLAFMLIAGSAWLGHSLSMMLIVLAMALPGLLSLFTSPGVEQQPGARDIARLDRPFFAAIWSCARWALPGVLVTWLFSNGYWFYLDTVQGKTMVASLAATRLFFTPVGLMIQGWAGYYRPMFSRLEHQREHAQKLRLVRRQAGVCSAVVVLFTLSLLLALFCYPRMLPSYLEPAMFVNLVLAWGGYFLVQWLRNILSTALLADAAGYRIVFKAGLAGAVLFYLFFIPAGWISSQLVICPLLLMLAEIFILAGLWRPVFGNKRND